MWRPWVTSSWWWENILNAFLSLEAEWGMRVGGQGVCVSTGSQELTVHKHRWKFSYAESSSRKECKRRSHNSFLSGVLIWFVDTDVVTAPDYFSKPGDSMIPSCVSLSLQSCWKCFVLQNVRNMFHSEERKVTLLCYSLSSYQFLSHS